MANSILGYMRLAAYALCVAILAFPAVNADAQCAFALGGGLLSGLPSCTVTQVLSIQISDGAGVPFASPGLL